MSKILVMSNDLANKIAAGEVVEKTMNVVKELVENSVDAGSSEIVISLIDSGVKEIKVVDNGQGMDRDDAQNCFLRHATSKLKNLNDLFNIASLGFRGEALPSIASVSNIVLKTSNGVVGTEVIINGGTIKSVTGSDIRKGTSITVSDLFYNTPVRLKYLKSLYAELANITDYVNKMALSYPNIKFVLINNDKELLNTDGSGNLLKVINAIYGLSTTKKMINLNVSNDDFKLCGYISYPEISRSNKNSITILVNNRYIRNNEINKAINEAYHSYIPQDRYPVIVLNIIVDPFLVDVNVHPTKMDVKFSKMDDLRNLIIESIRDSLKKVLLIPDVVTENNFIEEENIIEEENKIITELPFNFTVEDNNQVYLDTKKYDSKFYDSKEEVINKHANTILPIEPVGCAFNTYIIGQNEEGMYLIDQHAAAERINYEMCYNAITDHIKASEDLLIPITIELPNNEYLILKNHFDILDRLYFKYEEFGINTIIIRSYPIWLKEFYLEESIKKIIDIIVNNEDFSERKFNDHVAMTMACKMSIKAHDDLSMEDIRYLLNKLIKTNNPYTCPHGRPTIIKYTKYELEKLFKRAM